VTSCLNGGLVRVIRGPKASQFAPTSGYPYDGLFRVERWAHRTGASQFLVCHYLLIAATVENAAVTTPGVDSHISPPSGNVAPGRVTVSVQRVVRSTAVADHVKRLHDHTCQVCGTRLAIGDRGYSEGAHIRPLGRPHDGPDTTSNVLCLCPNCHVLFDNGAITIANDLTIVAAAVPPGNQLRTHAQHDIDISSLAYHAEIFAKVAWGT
jgi:putative restriction endonuclease